MEFALDRETPTALITGGSRGIGKAIAIKMASINYQVLFTFNSNSEEAEKTCQLVRDGGGRAKAIQLNVGDAGAIAKFFADKVKNNVNLAVLVNNAGITRDGLLLRMKDDQFEEVLNVNLRGAFICCREAAKLMVRRNAGRIVNIASIVGQMGNPGQANYSAAKAGLIGLTKALAKELASRQITVNAVAPGFIETDMTSQLSQAVKDEYIKAIPLGRLGTTDDVAEAVAFLVSSGASYITGQVLAVNGGMYC